MPRRQAHPVASSSNASVIGAASANGGSVSLANVVANGGVPGSSLGGGILSAGSLGGREISITSNPLQMAVAAAAAAAAASTSSPAGGNAGIAGAAAAAAQSQFLLTRFMTPALQESERTEIERNRADR